MQAVGRSPDTSKLFKTPLIKLAANNRIITNKDESTSVSNIFAIGDVCDGKIELTPPAIKAGKLLAERLFNNS